MTGAVKGWCPSAYRPMMSGDGLLVRVRPGLGRLSVRDVQVLTELATRFGNGMIGLTTRANLQLRGVKTSDHDAVLQALIAAGLVHRDPELEGRRAVLATPLWRAGDVTDRLGRALDDALPALPALPDKMGFAIDTGDAPMLRDASADVRIERDLSGGFLVVADGASGGIPVDERSVMDAVSDLLAWFVASGGMDHGRMARHLTKVALPGEFSSVAQALGGPVLVSGRMGKGVVVGVPFGAMKAADLQALVKAAAPTFVQLTPWRSLVLAGGRDVHNPAFVVAPDDPVLRVSACPGRPFCAEASVETIPLARQLAGRVDGTLHVSGCAKGCARAQVSDVTLVGRDGRFDLVQNGRSSDMALRTGLSDADLLELFPDAL